MSHFSLLSSSPLPQVLNGKHSFLVYDGGQMDNLGYKKSNGMILEPQKSPVLQKMKLADVWSFFNGGRGVDIF